ncbi:MAG: cysteine--tRNA ligase [Chitinophagales bacterium]
MTRALFHQNALYITNTLSRQKEQFEPLHPPFVGLYGCGPTVYSEPHLGNVRTFVSYDLFYRYLTHLGYKVRYVRNITDAGHIESTSGEAGDRISAQAKLEQKAPMEIVQQYSVKFHRIMEIMNCLPPSIEPTATGHIIEQIEMTKKIIENGYAYERNGSVYFDVEKFAAEYPYTQLSGRNLEELLNNTRDLSGQGEKKGRLDFALWIKAEPEHIMRWPSPWGEGYPGWHIECSAMSTKYLGEQFDIHAGGMDLIPTHHTNEIAQSIASNKCTPVKYWVHTNMLTVNGQKMSKSLGNSFLPYELFNGAHPLLDRAYPPMVVRFFMLQAHYSSTLDFTNEGLKAAEKNYNRLMSTYALLEKMEAGPAVQDADEKNANAFLLEVYAGMNNDLNSAQAIAALNTIASSINAWNSAPGSKAPVLPDTLERIQETYRAFLFDIFGLKNEKGEGNDKVLEAVMQLVIELRKDAREKKDFTASDKIRDQLKAAGVQLKDGKEGTLWDLG